MKPRTSISHRAQVVLAAALLVLAACGGSSGDGASPPASPPAATTLSVSGTITGFGSVIIDGQRFDDSRADVSFETNPAAPTSGSVSDLKLGMAVDGQVVDGQLTQVVVHAALIGPIATLDAAAGSFAVYGQTVKTVAGGATPTVFDGVNSVAGLAVGDVVEVHGTMDASQAITATRVERKPRTAMAQGVRLGGIAKAVDTTARSFRLNDLTVDYGAAVVLPAGQQPAEGRLVVAFGDAPPAAGVFHAKAIKIVTADDGTDFEIGGRIMAFASVADFTVSGVHVDASGATFDGGTAADLAAGVIVSARGEVVAGVLKASQVRVLRAPADVLSSLKGEITDWASSASFQVRGTTVDASHATFTGGSASDLGAGASVLVTGHVAGDLFVADRIQFIALPVAQPVRLQGEIRDLAADAGTFHFLGANIRLGEHVEFVGGTRADLADGKRVAVTGTPGADGAVVATRVEFLGDLAPQVSVVGGRVSAIADGTFQLPGIAVRFNADTTFEGGAAADLAEGVLVLAKGRFDPASRAIQATWIEIVKSDAGVPRVAGPISAFVSSADFHVGEQRIDASQATLIDGDASNLANGAIIEATGTLRATADGKVLAATSVHFLMK
jgi:hypothetical protein